MVYINRKNILARGIFRAMVVAAVIMVAMVLVDRFVVDFMSYNTMVNVSYVAGVLLLVDAWVSPISSFLKAKALEDNNGYAMESKSGRKIRCTTYYVASMYASSSFRSAIAAMLFLFTDTPVFDTFLTLCIVTFIVGFNLWFRKCYLDNKYRDVETNSLTIWTYLK